MDRTVDRPDGGRFVCGVGQSASALCDPMTDPRGGAFTLGLGLVPGVAFVAEAEQISPDRLTRTLKIADVPVLLALRAVPLSCGVPVATRRSARSPCTATCRSEPQLSVISTVEIVTSSVGGLTVAAARARIAFTTSRPSVTRPNVT